MTAIRFGKYGPPEVLKLRDVGPPVIGDDELLTSNRDTPEEKLSSPCE